MESDRIIGGYEASIDENPWQISLRKVQTINDDTFGYHKCGGVIIGEEWILTALHCIQ